MQPPPAHIQAEAQAMIARSKASRSSAPRATGEKKARTPRQPLVVNGKEVVVPRGTPSRVQSTAVRRGTHRRRAQVVGMHMTEFWQLDEKERHALRAVGLAGKR